MSPRCYYIIGGIILVISVIALASFDSIYNAIMEGLLVIDPDGMIYDSFKVPPVDIYMQFMLFNITNAYRVMYFGEKPILKEVGPYTFLETREKYDITYNKDDDGVIMFRNLHNYKFVPDKSVGSLDDDVTTINAVLVVVGEIAEALPVVRNIIWPELESKMSVLESHKVGEILFDGWNMPKYNFDFSALSKLPLGEIGSILEMTKGVNGTLYEILQDVVEFLDPNSTFLDKIEFLEANKIGYMYGRNGVDDGYYKIATGKDDMSQYQEILEWNHLPSLTFWNSKYCNMINGTDGTQLAPHVQKEDTIYIFSSDLCRSLYFKYEKDIELYDTKLYRFIPPEKMLGDHITNPDNLCYCPGGEETCLGAGFINLESCMSKVPVIMSSPHFYQGDDDERAKLIGLEPDKSKHETILDIQPRTGLVMNAHKRIQLNFPLKKLSTLPSFRNVPEVILPILWLDEYAIATEGDMDTLHTALSLPFTIVYSVFGCLTAISVVILGVAMHKKRKLNAIA